MSTSIITALAAVAGALIAALFGIGRLIGDKETKVTEFRKSWIESLRSDISDFTAASHIITGRIIIRKNHESEKKKSKSLGSLIRDIFFKDPPLQKAGSGQVFDRELESELLPNWEKLRKAYNSIILHINPSEQAACMLAEKYIDGLKLAEPSIDASGTIIDEKSTRLTALLEIASEAIGRKKQWLPPWQRKPPAVHTDTVTPQNITDCCESSADALLLAIFVCKKLLEAKNYDFIVAREKQIEKSIMVIDRAGSHVIKNVWEKIKRGEGKYRITTWSFSLLGIILFLLVAAAAYKFWPRDASPTDLHNISARVASLP